MDYVPLAAQWAEGEWGYIRNMGVEYRTRVMCDLSQYVYIGLFAEKPVAMFALLERKFSPDLVAATDCPIHARELMYVYVDKNYRGFGFGKQIIDEAKQLAKQAGATLILLDTLKPSLNRFYEKQGARIVCESELFSHATDVLKISV